MTNRVRALFTRAFWLDAAERSIKSAAQGAAGLLTLDQFTDKVQSSPLLLVGAAGCSALYSLLTSIASAPVTGSISPASIITPEG